MVSVKGSADNNKLSLNKMYLVQPFLQIDSYKNQQDNS